jgi:hypothetical protein
MLIEIGDGFITMVIAPCCCVGDVGSYVFMFIVTHVRNVLGVVFDPRGILLPHIFKFIGKFL